MKWNSVVDTLSFIAQLASLVPSWPACMNNQRYLPQINGSGRMVRNREGLESFTTWRMSDGCEVGTGRVTPNCPWVLLNLSAPLLVLAPDTWSDWWVHSDPAPYVYLIHLMSFMWWIIPALFCFLAPCINKNCERRADYAILLVVQASSWRGESLSLRLAKWGYIIM